MYRIKKVFVNLKCVSSLVLLRSYLGVLIDKHLSWKTHIDSLCNKISRNVGVISKLRHYLPNNCATNNVYTEFIMADDWKKPWY